MKESAYQSHVVYVFPVRERANGKKAVARRQLTKCEYISSCAWGNSWDFFAARLITALDSASCAGILDCRVQEVFGSVCGDVGATVGKLRFYGFRRQ